MTVSAATLERIRARVEEVTPAQAIEDLLSLHRLCKLKAEEIDPELGKALDAEEAWIAEVLFRLAPYDLVDAIAIYQEHAVAPRAHSDDD